jgi:CheY-like chemotaxis protein/transcriptional regulator with XRE-family HTH domain
MNDSIMMDLEQENNVVEAFAAELKAALDHVNFPKSPERVAKLMELLELSRPQVYRIATGKAAPTLESLIKFRELNISIDDILDRVIALSEDASSIKQGTKRWVQGSVDIQGIANRCSLSLAPLNEYATVIATLQDDGVWHVGTLAQDKKTPNGAMAVEKIRLERVRPNLAIVDDHAATLTTLCEQFKSHFNVSPFAEGTALLKSSMVKQFDCFLLDWRLPDIAGRDLIMSIRNITTAPIFVVTGEKSSRDIASIVASANIRYAVKPIDDVILAAEMMNAVALRVRPGVALV